MRSSCRAGALLLVLASLTAVVSAKGTTTRIIVTGPQLSEPIQLRDRDVVAPFNVWSGPGTTMNGVESMDGFIVDWRGGAVQPPVANLERFELSFHASENRSGSDRQILAIAPM